MTLLYSYFLSGLGKASKVKDTNSKQEQQGRKDAKRQRSASVGGRAASGKRRSASSTGTRPEREPTESKSEPTESKTTRVFRRVQAETPPQTQHTMQARQISSNGYVEILRIERCGDKPSSCSSRQSWTWACQVFGFPFAQISSQQRSTQFRLLSKAVHPDKNLEAAERARAAFQRVNAANEILKSECPAGLPVLPPSEPAATQVRSASPMPAGVPSQVRSASPTPAGVPGQVRSASPTPAGAPSQVRSASPTPAAAPRQTPTSQGQRNDASCQVRTASPTPQQTRSASPTPSRPHPATSSQARSASPAPKAPKAVKRSPPPPATVPVSPSGIPVPLTPSGIPVPVTPSSDVDADSFELPFELAHSLGNLEKFIDKNSRSISGALTRRTKSGMFNTARSTVSNGTYRPTVGDWVTVLNTRFTRESRPGLVGKRLMITGDDPHSRMAYEVEGSFRLGEEDIAMCGVSKVLREINGMSMREI